MYMHYACVWCLQRPKEGIESTRNRAANDCERLCGCQNQICVLRKSSQCSASPKHLLRLSEPQTEVLHAKKSELGPGYSSGNKMSMLVYLKHINLLSTRRTFQSLRNTYNHVHLSIITVIVTKQHRKDVQTMHLNHNIAPY